MRFSSTKYQRILIYIGIICAFLSLDYLYNELKYHHLLPLDIIFITTNSLSILVMIIVLFGSYFDKVTQLILTLPNLVKLPFIVIVLALGLMLFVQIAIMVRAVTSGFYWETLYFGYCAIAAFFCNVHLLALLTGSKKKGLEPNCR
jgi:hypothetical protein